MNTSGGCDARTLVGWKGGSQAAAAQVDYTHQGATATRMIKSKTRGFRESFVRRHQRVLVLNRKYVIVAQHPQRGDEFLPPAEGVIAARAENPRSIPLVRVLPGMPDTCQRQIAVTT